MKTETAQPTELDKLRNFWSALPDCASFRFFFDCPLSEVENAAREVTRAEQELAAAKRNHAEAMKRLTDRVEGEARTGWSADQIAQAKLEGGAL